MPIGTRPCSCRYTLRMVDCHEIDCIPRAFVSFSFTPPRSLAPWSTPTRSPTHPTTATTSTPCRSSLHRTDPELGPRDREGQYVCTDQDAILDSFQGLLLSFLANRDTSISGLSARQRRYMLPPSRSCHGTSSTLCHHPPSTIHAVLPALSSSFRRILTTDTQVR